MARRGHKKRRTNAADAGPSAAFLAALASQRDNARRREQQEAEREQPEPSEAARSEVASTQPPPPKELPGFYYDESKQRYFRCAAEQQRKQARSLKIRLAPGRAVASSAASTGTVTVKSSRPTNARRRGALSGSSFQTCLDRRQQSYAWSANGRDRRALKPLFLGQFFALQVLDPQPMGAGASQNRLTGLALHPNASNLGAIGYSNGRVVILGTERVVEKRARSDIVGGGDRDDHVKIHTKHVVKLQEVSVGGSSWVSSLQWRPQRSLDVLFSVVGASQSVGNTPTGFVGLLDVGQQDAVRVHPPRKWTFTDPWTAAWNPYSPTGFSVGMGADSCAAFVIPELPGERGIIYAPRGLCRSPVVSQAFFRKSQSILNGTRNGSLWIWDLRAKRRAQELVNNYPSSVVSLDILQDDMSVVVQRSNGQLALMDVRKYNQVLEFACGRHNAHLPMLKFAVDGDESVVVAAGGEDPRAVTTYSIQTGNPVASVHVARSSRSAASEDQAAAPVEQVHFLTEPVGSAHPGGPELWALSRSDLFMCSSWRTDVEARE